MDSTPYPRCIREEETGTRPLVLPLARKGLMNLWTEEIKPRILLLTTRGQNSKLVHRYDIAFIFGFIGYTMHPTPHHSQHDALVERDWIEIAGIAAFAPFLSGFQACFQGTGVESNFQFKKDCFYGSFPVSIRILCPGLGRFLLELSLGLLSRYESLR